MSKRVSRSEEKTLDVERSLHTISAVDLFCPEDYVVDGRNMLRDGDSIVYSGSQHAAAGTDFIFYGPYLTLPPGVYLFGFNGKLDGELAIDFADQEGTVILKKLTIKDLLDPACLAVTKTLAKFEVRGFKTPSLNTLRLDSISVEAIRFPSMP
jgi:hypothetical protein